jgi:gamma-glutamyl hydrolase
MFLSSCAALLLLVVVCLSSPAAVEGKQWEAPVVGVFSWTHNANSEHLEASYVKWVESAGGRVVPISSTMWTEAQYDEVFSQINGLLLPGGGAEPSEGMKYLFAKAVKANKEGDYFPVWGTCLGFQLITMMYR